jgi:hypothetical protein
MENHGRNSARIAVSNSLASPKPRRLTDFPSVGRNELRKDAGGCREVPAGGGVSEDSRVTCRAHPPAGTGRHGHGDWMETDRCVGEGNDLLIPGVRARAELLIERPDLDELPINPSSLNNSAIVDGRHRLTGSHEADPFGRECDQGDQRGLRRVQRLGAWVSASMASRHASASPIPTNWRKDYASLRWARWVRWLVRQRSRDRGSRG